jgi:hypothetical protein
MGNAARSEQTWGPPVVMGEEEIMSPKEHGTCAHGVQENLLYGCDRYIEFCSGVTLQEQRQTRFVASTGTMPNTLVIG